MLKVDSLYLHCIYAIFTLYLRCIYTIFTLYLHYIYAVFTLLHSKSPSTHSDTLEHHAAGMSPHSRRRTKRYTRVSLMKMTGSLFPGVVTGHRSASSVYQTPDLRACRKMMARSTALCSNSGATLHYVVGRSCSLTQSI